MPAPGPHRFKYYCSFNVYGSRRRRSHAGRAWGTALAIGVLVGSVAIFSRIDVPSAGRVALPAIADRAAESARPLPSTSAPVAKAPLTRRTEASTPHAAAVDTLTMRRESGSKVASLDAPPSARTKAAPHAVTVDPARRSVTTLEPARTATRTNATASERSRTARSRRSHSTPHARAKTPARVKAPSTDVADETPRMRPM